MQVEEHIYLMRLFDEYGKLLSNKQQEVMDKFLNLDIGESEIAEIQNESRQSVHDAISKAKKQLMVFEDNCGFVKKQMELETACLKLKALLDAENYAQAKKEIDEIINLL